jgi:hypothetical protein
MIAWWYTILAAAVGFFISVIMNNNYDVKEMNKRETDPRPVNWYEDMRIMISAEVALQLANKRILQTDHLIDIKSMLSEIMKTILRGKGE